MAVFGIIAEAFPEEFSRSAGDDRRQSGIPVAQTGSEERREGNRGLS
jgi:hypothetical protein